MKNSVDLRELPLYVWECLRVFWRKRNIRSINSILKTATSEFQPIFCQAEVQLRLKRYEDAFDSFRELASMDQEVGIVLCHWILHTYVIMVEYIQLISVGHIWSICLDKTWYKFDICVCGPTFRYGVTVRHWRSFTCHLFACVTMWHCSRGWWATQSVASRIRPKDCQPCGQCLGLRILMILSICYHFPVSVSELNT